jgi:hypothetical protein
VSARSEAERLDTGHDHAGEVLTMKLLQLIMPIVLVGLRVAPCWADLRPVHVDVTVQDSSGSAVAGVNVAAAVRPRGQTVPTDAAGVAAFDLQVESGAPRAVIYLTPKSPYNEQARVHAERDRFRQVVSANGFRQYYLLPLPPDQKDLKLTIRATPSVVVRGRLVKPDGTVAKALAVAAESPTDVNLPDKEGRFVLSGVPRGEARLIFVSSTIDQHLIKVIRVSAADTQSDKDLGDVVFAAEADEGTRLRLSVTNIDAIRWVPTAKSRFVTLIATDASMVRSIPLNDAGATVTSRTDTSAPKVPPGTYFTVAGPVGFNRAVAKVIAALDAGRGAELIAAGLPRVVVPATGECQATVDGAIAENAVWAVCGEE